MTASLAAPAPWQEAVIERIVPQTPRIVSVFLRAGLPPHAAGQHLDVRLTAPDGYQAQRSYSIASAPEAASLELAIERLEDGEVSPFFHAVAQPGDTIEVRGPIGGHFVWGAADGGPLLLIAAGSGVAPLMAMVRHRAAVAPDTPALLVYSARTWDDLAFRDELLRAEAREPDFSLVLATTREPRRRPADVDRRLDEALLGEILARWGHAPRHVYVCGSNAFVEAVTGNRLGKAAAPEDIRTERFGGTL